MSTQTGDLTGCLSNCSGNGQCRLNQNTQMYSCSCESNFLGTSCQFDIRPCSMFPCMNNATCLNIDNLNGSFSFECKCQTGFYGVYCEKEPNICENVTCNSNGYCYNDGGERACKCLINFYGDECQTEATFGKIVKGVQMTSLIIACVCIGSLVTFIILNDVWNIFIPTRNIRNYYVRNFKRTKTVLRFTYKHF